MAATKTRLETLSLPPSFSLPNTHNEKPKDRQKKPDGALAIVHGPVSPGLYTNSLGTLIREQAATHGTKTAVVVPWQNNTRLSYVELDRRSCAVASSLLSEFGIKSGDIVGIMAGNRYEYLEVFLGATRIGAPVAVLNNTYKTRELVTALEKTSAKALFIASGIGARSLESHIEAVWKACNERVLSKLQHIVVFGHNSTIHKLPTNRTFCALHSYSKFILAGSSREYRFSETLVREAEKKVIQSDMANLQFTSGTTGSPKAAMLTHRNIINNGFLVGSRMNLSTNDIICCPPPLFHCFGLVMGFLASFFHGASIVFPSDVFDANATLDALYHERCTALLGVPTMFIAELDALKSRSQSSAQGSNGHNLCVTKGLAAGSTVPPPLLRRLEAEMGLKGILIAYGMTETSPVTFMMGFDDPPQRLVKGLGKVMPHTSAKVVNSHGKIVKRGEKGEIWTSGYALMKGYLNNEEKSKEVLIKDEEGRVWMRTGDECVIDEEGYCEITGRIKDLIIRGGENIFPAEIEEVLLSRPSIADVSVVGIQDEKYGEVVGCFLKLKEGSQQVRPRDDEVRQWVRDCLGRHKAPQWVFWLGDPGVGDDFPKTGSGKHQKHILRAIGDSLVKKRSQIRARL